MRPGANGSFWRSRHLLTASNVGTCAEFLEVFLKPPAFQFYADDFLGGTADMTQSEIGAYILLLCQQWNRGAIPTDPERQKVLAKGEVSSHVLSKFSQTNDGELKNARMEIVRREQKKFSKAQSDNGKAGAKARWRNHGDPNGGAIIPPLATPMAENSSPTPTPTPTPSPIKREEVASLPLSKFQKPSIEDCRVESERLGMSAGEGDCFFHFHESKGWIIGKSPMKSWKSAMQTWKHRQQPANGASESQTNKIILGKEYERVIERQRTLRATYGDHQTWSEPDKMEWNKLRTRKTELKTILGITV